MAELEQLLAAAAHEVDWPPVSEPSLPAGARRPRHRGLVLALAACLVALAVAMVVPGARTAILRALHLEGVSIVRVEVLPPAQERPLGVGLGAPVSARQARQALSAPFALPPLHSQPQLYLDQGAVSALLDAGGPVLLSELRVVGVGGEVILKKVVGPSTNVSPVQVGDAQGAWISGEEHLYVAPGAPPRLAGNVLLWQRDGILYRLEGPKLELKQALNIAGRLGGT
jgi:hypothetical protein